MLSTGLGKSKYSVNIGFLPLWLSLLLAAEQLLHQPTVLVSMHPKHILRCGLCALGKAPRREGQWSGGSRTGTGKRLNKGSLSGEVPDSARSRGVPWGISAPQTMFSLEAKDLSF